MDPPEIVYKLITEPDQIDEALDLLVRDFLKRETLQIARGDLNRTEEDNIHLLVFKACFQQHLSFGAFDSKTGKIVGVRLNGIQRKSDPKPDEPNTDYRFLSFLEDGVDFFERESIDGYLQFFCLSVDQNYENKGIASRLLDLSIALAKEKGFALIKTTATSPAMQHIFSKLGFEVAEEYRILDYKEDGKTIYFNADPNSVVQLLFKRL